MTERTNEESGRESVEPSEGLLALIRDNPLGTASLLASMVLGSALCYAYLDAGLSDWRRVVGGALAGFGCWLCVSVGRAIG